MDVDALARGNGPLWRERADDVCGAGTSRAEFRRVATGSAVGTNAEATKLAHFRSLDPPRLVSTYEVRRSDDDDDRAEVDLYGVGDWGPRRKAFEHAVGIYRTAVYGTLDLPGCPGDDTYGPYRLSYLPPEDRLPWVLPHNSALVYGAGGAFQDEAFRQDVGAWDSRGDIAAVQLGDDAERRPADRWPRLLGTAKSDDDLVEVVIGRGQVPLADVTEIRISEKFAESMEEALLVRNLATEDDPGRIEDPVRLYKSLWQEAASGGAPMSVVQDSS